MLEISFSQLFYFIETVGVMAFALSGFIKARQHNFDFVGVYILSLITAFGGGTIRDLILDNQPVYWIAHSEYPLFLFFLIAGLSLFKRDLLKPNWLFVPDALGMSFFAITAAQSAYQAGYSFIIVGILATIVASFGGVIRDSLCQETPIIFKKSSTMYASIAFLGATLLVLFNEFTGFDSITIMIFTAVVTFVIRLIVCKFQLKSGF